MREIKWEHNASTGQQIANVTKNGRIMRQGFNDGTFLYRAEFWGDYSLRYPTRAQLPTPIACRGQQGLWPVDGTTVHEAWDQIEPHQAKGGAA